MLTSTVQVYIRIQEYNFVTYNFISLGLYILNSYGYLKIDIGTRCSELLTYDTDTRTNVGVSYEECSKHVKYSY